MAGGSILDDPTRIIGQFVCPHDDGDYTTKIIDLECMFTGACMVRQEGQGEVHDQVYTRDEAKKLGLFLLAFAYPNAQFAQFIDQLND